MEKSVILDKLVKKKVKTYGTGGHIVMPKDQVGNNVYIVIERTITRPMIHYDQEKETDGVKYVKAEVSDGAGTHGIWLRKDKIPSIFTRN